MRKRLAALTIALGALLPLTAVAAAHAGPASIQDSRHWACVGEVDVNIGVCLDNPIPPWPFAPVKFSGLIERLSAFDNRDSTPRCIPSPLNPAIAAPSLPFLRFNYDRHPGRREAVSRDPAAQTATSCRRAPMPERLGPGSILRIVRDDELS